MNISEEGDKATAVAEEIIKRPFGDSNCPRLCGTLSLRPPNWGGGGREEGEEGERGRRGGVGLHMCLQIGTSSEFMKKMSKKNEKKKQPLTRRGRVGGGRGGWH